MNWKTSFFILTLFLIFLIVLQIIFIIKSYWGAMEYIDLSLYIVSIFSSIIFINTLYNNNDINSRISYYQKDGDSTRDKSINTYIGSGFINKNTPIITITNNSKFNYRIKDIKSNLSVFRISNGRITLGEKYNLNRNEKFQIAFTETEEQTFEITIKNYIFSKKIKGKIYRDLNNPYFESTLLYIDFLDIKKGVFMHLG